MEIQKNIFIDKCVCQIIRDIISRNLFHIFCIIYRLYYIKEHIALIVKSLSSNMASRLAHQILILLYDVFEHTRNIFNVLNLLIYFSVHRYNYLISL